MSDKGLAPTPSAVCTRVCTSEGENANAGQSDGGPGDQGEVIGADQGEEGADDAHGGAKPDAPPAPPDQGDPLAALAAELGKLSPEDRQRLAALLIGHQSEGEGSAGA